MGKHFQPITVEPYFRCINHGQIVSMNDKDVLGNRGEDAQPCTEFLDGSSGFEPAVSLLLLGFEELITEVLPLLRRERTEDPGNTKPASA